MAIERALIAVLCVSQAATGWLLYQQTDELESLQFRVSYEAQKTSDTHAVFHEELGRLNFHNHGENPADQLKDTVFDLEMAHLDLVGSVMALQKDVKGVSDDLLYTKVRVKPLELRLENIDCGEKAFSRLGRGEDETVCRRKK